MEWMTVRIAAIRDLGHLSPDIPSNGSPVLKAKLKPAGLSETSLSEGQEDD